MSYIPSSYDNLTIIASSNEFCGSCTGEQCSIATNVTELVADNDSLKAHISDRRSRDGGAAKNRYVGEVDLPERLSLLCILVNFIR